MGDKDTFFDSKARPVNCAGKQLDFSRPLIMGVLNLTPDSFYDGGKYHQEKQRAMRVEQMLEEGADIIDLGAVSTRPGSRPIPPEEEIERLIWPLQRLSSRFPDAIFSIDTFRADVARESILHGGHIVNDISGGTFDDKMFETIAELQVPYILMHIHQTPATMQQEPISSAIVPRLRKFFEEKVEELNGFGIHDIILDPGFGFGKTLKCNYAILRNLQELRVNNLPILGGISRKSMINKVLNIKPSEALNGTTVLNTLALQNGANILRVHDVKEAAEAIRIVAFYEELGDCEAEE